MSRVLASALVQPARLLRTPQCRPSSTRGLGASPEPRATSSRAAFTNECVMRSPSASRLALVRPYSTTANADTAKRIGRSDRILPSLGAPTPKAIAAKLDEYVIGQTRAKRALSVGVFNHYLRLAGLQRAKAAREQAEAAQIEEAIAAKAEADERAARSLTDSEERGRDSDDVTSAKQSDKDAVLTDYVGQAQGSRRWAMRDGERHEHARSNTPPLSPAYFSSAKWPAYFEPRASKNKEVAPSISQTKPRKAESPTLSAEDGPATPPSLSNFENSIQKSNILMIGPSGSGKTHLVRTLATTLSVPFVHADATPLTSAGYVGEDVESILSRLLEAAGWDVERAERGIICIDEIDKLASPATAKTGTSVAGRDVGGTGVQQALLRILEGTVVSLPDKRPSGASQGAWAAPRSSKAASTKPWWSPEMQALNAEQTGRSASSSGDGAREGGSSNLRSTSPSAGAAALAMTRKSRKDGAATAHGSSGADAAGTIKIDTSNILFVCCGAFAGLQEIVAARAHETSLKVVEADDLTRFGLIPEFVGRLPVVVTLDALSKNDLVRILTEPRNALVTQYQNLFASFNVKLHFTQAALEALAGEASALSGASSGARSLRRLLEARLLDTMYDAPGGGVRYALVDRKAALGEREVLLYSRGGRSAWLNAMDEDDERPATTGGKGSAKSSSPSVRVAAPQTPPRKGLSSPSPRAGVFSRIDETMLRRRARARLTRPSRVGNLRIMTSEG